MVLRFSSVASTVAIAFASFAVISVSCSFVSASSARRLSIVSFWSPRRLSLSAKSSSKSKRFCSSVRSCSSSLPFSALIASTVVRNALSSSGASAAELMPPSEDPFSLAARLALSACASAMLSICCLRNLLQRSVNVCMCLYMLSVFHLVVAH